MNVEEVKIANVQETFAELFKINDQIQKLKGTDREIKGVDTASFGMESSAVLRMMNATLFITGCSYFDVDIFHKLGYGVNVIDCAKISMPLPKLFEDKDGGRKANPDLFTALMANLNCRSQLIADNCTKAASDIEPIGTTRCKVVVTISGLDLTPLFAKGFIDKFIYSNFKSVDEIMSPDGETKILREIYIGFMERVTKKYFSTSISKDLTSGMMIDVNFYSRIPKTRNTFTLAKVITPVGVADLLSPNADVNAATNVLNTFKNDNHSRMCDVMFIAACNADINTFMQLKMANRTYKWILSHEPLDGLYLLNNSNAPKLDLTSEEHRKFAARINTTLSQLEEAKQAIIKDEKNQFGLPNYRYELIYGFQRVNFLLAIPADDIKKAANDGSFSIKELQTLIDAIDTVMRAYMTKS